MENPDNRIDLQFLRETVRQFKKDNRLSDAELGRILNPEISSLTGQSMKGKSFWEESRDISLREVSALAERMGVSFLELLRPVSYAVHQGDHCTQVIQHGQGASTHVADHDDGDCHQEDYEEFMEFRRWQKARKASRERDS